MISGFHSGIVTWRRLVAGYRRNCTVCGCDHQRSSSYSTWKSRRKKA